MVKKITKYFYFNGKTYSYEVSYKDMRRIILKIDNKNKIKVSCPFYTSDSTLNSFIYENMNQIMKLKERKEENSKFNIEKNNFSLLGNKINVSIKRTNGNNTFSFKQNILSINLRNNDDLFNVMKRFYNKEAKKIIPKYVDDLEHLTGINCNSLSIKWMDSKWGHCDSFNNIVLSSKLLIHKEEIIRYVIIHELCHIIHKNHSSDFWDLVSKYAPNYKELRKEMKGI